MWRGEQRTAGVGFGAGGFGGDGAIKVKDPRSAFLFHSAKGGTVRFEAVGVLMGNMLAR